MIRRRGDLLGEALAHGGPHRKHGERGVLRNFRRQPPRLFAHIGERRDLIHHAEVQRFLALYAPAGEEHQVGGLRPDQLRQRDGEAEARMNAQFHEIGGETGFRRGNAEVRRQREPEPAADGGALHRRHHRLFGAEQTDAFSVKQAGGVLETVFGELGAVGAVVAAGAEVGAGAERLAVGSQHDGAALRIVVQRAIGVGDLRDEIAVEEIVRRPVDLHGGDVAFQTDVDVGERAGHALPLLCIPCAYRSSHALPKIESSLAVRCVRLSGSPPLRADAR